jgi:signal peptidase I
VDTLRRNFDVEDGTIPGLPPSQFHAGDVIARGSVDTGDHVFVDKVSYNLHLPTRGEVFVFSTRGIPLIDQSLRTQGVDGSQFYIKRLAGLPLDHIQVHSPELYINGEKAMEFGFQRVMSRLNGYRGYSNPYDAAYINTPDSSITVPPNHYFAMGDNSYNSWDSRFWGPVPEGNLMGRALFVYWPFLPHWGFVK